MTTTAAQPQTVRTPRVRNLTSLKGLKTWIRDHKLSRRTLVVVCGSRSWGLASIMRKALETHMPAKAIVLTGDQRGAARLAASTVLRDGTPVASFPAPGKDNNARRPGRLSFARNSLMLAAKPKLVIAFTEDLKVADEDTRDLCLKAFRAGIPIISIDTSGSAMTYDIGKAELSAKQLLEDAAQSYPEPVA